MKFSSNLRLNVVSKIVEKVVGSRLNDHLVFNHLDEPLQSAHKPFHSCEAALFCLHNDGLRRAVDNHRCVVLLLLDLSAAFDTVDHSLLLSRLPSKLGNRGKALQWFESYLSSRSQFVANDLEKSHSHDNNLRRT